MFDTQHTMNKMMDMPNIWKHYLNLYLRGEFEFSGAGNPPHHETNEVICNAKKHATLYSTG